MSNGLYSNGSWGIINNMLGKKTYILFGLRALVVLGFIGKQGQSDDGKIFVPTIPKAVGGECVAPPEVMRKSHMVMLKHDRDLKVKGSNLDIDTSLKDCIACHVVRDDVGAPVSVESPKHFCRACHDYAAVKIDCFSCHNSKPDETMPMMTESPHPIAWTEDEAPKDEEDE